MSDQAIEEALRVRCRKLPSDPGIYRMLDAAGTVIYVGKARNLNRRVSSYFNRNSGASPKIKVMLGMVRDIEVTVTRNENEALILESNLIKELKPRYNIVLRDDKSYPYIYLASDKRFPRLSFHRGARGGKGRYFGPFPNAGAVRSTLNLLQKLFMVRQCEESYFNNRTRPCLQYQIKRCTAPCVGLVSEDDYAADVGHAVLFLDGRSQEITAVLIGEMEKAAEGLEFERAARLRDQIADLQRLQADQHVTGGHGDCDIVVCSTRAGVGCVQVLFIRAGRNLGNKGFFPAHTREATSAEILEAFLAQFYLVGHADRNIPPDVILGEPIRDERWLATVLAQKRGAKVTVRHNVRGERAKWIEMARQNAVLALTQRISASADYQRRLEALQEFLHLPEAIQRIECFDVSHTRGESTVASCVVFGTDGPRRSDYRLFNVAIAQGGDDYAALREAIHRRYSRVKREEGELPQVLLIDGGKGQVSQGVAVLQDLQIEDMALVGIAKGATRKPGFERLIFHDGRRERTLPDDSIALHMLQQIRDEAHRFAITAHRRARAAKRSKSSLESIAGIGAKRRQGLIQHFGGLQGVAGAGVGDLQKVRGISRQLAQKIYDALHE